jgi:hypothetical protein
MVGMNPFTNQFEGLHDYTSKMDEAAADGLKSLLRPDGTPVPKHWSIFRVNEIYEINGYMFKCKYIGDTSILFEPHGPIIIGENQDE